MPRASRALSAYDHFAAMVAERGAGSAWAALSAFLLVAIARQRKNLLLSLGEILQVVSVKFS